MNLFKVKLRSWKQSHYMIAEDAAACEEKLKGLLNPNIQFDHICMINTEAIDVDIKTMNDKELKDNMIDFVRETRNVTCLINL